MDTKKIKIAVYAIAKNEEQFVESWYNSAKDADYLLIADTGSEDETIKLKDGVKNLMVTRLGLQVRFTDAETGVVFGASGLGEATTKRELTFLSDATVDEVKFNQSTISIATKKALDIACARILDRMIKKGVFTK